MFSLISHNERSPRPTLTAFATLSALGLGALLCAAGCVSAGATAASNNAQGVEYFSSGQYDKAIAYFEDSLAENPDSAETYYNLGSAYQRKANQLGDPSLLAKAEEYYWTALEHDPAPETIVCCYRGIATSGAARGDAESAMRALEDWRDRNPDSVEPKLEIAYLLEAQERDDDAYEALQEVAQIAPNDYRAFYKMGELSERAGDLDDAVERTQVAAQLKPDNEEVAQRVRILETRYAAKQRELEEESEDDEEDQTAVADDETTSSQTARVQSTSAQTESEAPPELVLPDDAQLPTSPDATQPQTNAPSASARPTLGFGEVVALSRPDAASNFVQTARTQIERARTNTTRFVDNVANSVEREVDSDVRWISANVEQGKTKVAQTSATVSQATKDAVQKSQDAVQNAAKNLAEESKKASNAAKTTANNLKTDLKNAAENASRALNSPETIAASTYKPPQSSKKKTKDRPEMGSGIPSMKAGSIF